MSLTEGRVRKRLFDLWLPMIGGIVAVKTIGLADIYFVGKLGQQALAAISFTFPIVMTLISLAIGLSAGASSILSRAIGEGASDEAQQAIVAGSICVAVATAALLTGVGYFGIGALLELMGARGQVLADATDYMQIWLLGSVCLIVPVAINGLLRATGDGVSPAALLIAAAVFNVSLNPLFVFGFGPVPGLGMQGAAVATVAGRGLGMVAAIALIWNKGLLRVSLGRIREGLGHLREIARIGLPASLSTSLNPMALSIATAAAATLGEVEVAAFGVATKIQSFAVVPLLALSAASSPFVGQNSSAGEIRRSRRALYWCAGLSIGWSALAAAVLAISAGGIASFFTDDAEVSAAAALFLMIVPASFAGYGIAISLSAAMNGLGRPFTALSISGGRALVLLAPATWIGAGLGGFTGIAIGFAAANVVAGLVGFVVMRGHSLTTSDVDRAANCDPADCD